MRLSTWSWLMPVAVAILAVASLVAWLRDPGMAPSVQLRLPGQEIIAASPIGVGALVRNLGALIAGTGVPSTLPGSWPQFLGADRSNVVHDAPSLSRTWPAGGPPMLWSLPVGEGHAGAAVRSGCVYLTDYDADKREDAIRCLSLDDGREIWRYTYYDKVKRNHGMSRTVPAVTDRFVVSLGPMCAVRCLDAATGKLVWQMDLVKDFGAVVPPWYAGQCPLLDSDAVILAPGGDPLLIKVDLASGRIVWRTPNPGGWQMTHSSIMPFDYHGARQYVYCTTQGVVAVDAADGRILWTKPDWRIALATVPSPVPIAPDRLFFTGGYNSGCVMVRVKGDGSGLTTEEVFRRKSTEFASDQQTPILYRAHLYAVMPDGQLACMNLDGKVLWTSGAATRFGLGPLLLADGLLLVLNDQEGTLRLVEATPDGYRELAAAKALDGHDAWGPMALVGDRLILRDNTTMKCLRLPTEAGRRSGGAS